MLVQQARQSFTQPVGELSRMQRGIRRGVDLVRLSWHQMLRHNATEMAAALTYRTIFGLVPFSVLALLIFKAFGGLESWDVTIQQRIYDYMGLDFSVPAQQVETPPSAAADTEAATTQPATQSASAATQPTRSQQQQARAVNQILAGLNERVAQVSFASIGAVGIVLLIWAALSLVVTVEECFNRIFACEVGRSWAMRVAIYWAAITLGPVLLMLSIWLTSQVQAWIDALPQLLAAGGAWASEASKALVAVLQWILNGLSYFAALLATWVLFGLLFVLLPNTRVKVRAAIIGAGVAAVCWELGKWAFGLYVQNAVGYSALYGSLGLIPLFLLWLYVTWLIVLMGLQITYTVQVGPTEGLIEEAYRDEQVLLDPRWLIALMAVMGEQFEQGQASSVESLAQRTGLTRRVTARLCEQLHQAGWVHWVQPAGGDATAGYVPARSPQHILLAELLTLGQKLGMAAPAAVQRTLPGQAWLDQLAEAQQQALHDATLAMVIEKNQ
jgi:membrane protein